MSWYAVVPFPWADGEPDADAGEPAGGPAEELFLGWSGGVPVWARARRSPDGWVLERLIATDPDLFLAAALAPGARLPLPPAP